jgi:hypothetical protein
MGANPGCLSNRLSGAPRAILFPVPLPIAVYESNQSGKRRRAPGRKDEETRTGNRSGKQKWSTIAGKSIKRAEHHLRAPSPDNVPGKFPGKLQKSRSRTAPQLNSPDRQPGSAARSGNQNGGAGWCSKRASGSSAVPQLTFPQTVRS